MRTLGWVVATAGTTTLLFTGAGFCQEPIFYPAKGQDGQQQARDQGECQVWAQRTTGINPSVLAQTAPPPAATGPAVGGGERLAGAARGAIIGELAGGHGGEGAAIGAMAGGGRARRNQAQKQQSAQAESSSARASQINTYNRATGACMEGRGYSVK